MYFFRGSSKFHRTLLAIKVDTFDFIDQVHHLMLKCEMFLSDQEHGILFLVVKNVIPYLLFLGCIRLQYRRCA